MPTTSNFGWTTPADTDLVKDGALAIRTLGNGIDTSLVDLKGGTTGQILSKASNTDLDYTWINNDQGDITEVQAGTGISVASGTGPIPIVTNTVATAFDAKGDLIGGTGADTFSRLAVGTNGQVLTADSTTATGLKWATPASGTTFAGCRIYMSAATTSISNNTWTTVNFDSEAYDTDAFHSTTTNTSRITIPSGKAGYYLIIATADFAQNSTSSRGISILVNGSEKGFTSIAPNTYEGANFNDSIVVSLAVGDYVEMQVRQTSGGALNLRGSTVSGTNLIAAYLGA